METPARLKKASFHYGYNSTASRKTMNEVVHARGENLRSAVRWLPEQKDHSLQAIHEALRKFDLSPLDTEFLIRMFAGNSDNEAHQNTKRSG